MPFRSAALRESKQIGVYVAWLYIHFSLIIGFTAFGVSVEHVVLSNQSLALPSSEKWLLCASTFLCLFALGVIQMTSAMTASHVSLSSSSANPRKTIKYAAAIYSLVAAIVVLLLGATLNNNILPVFLIGLMAIACTGQVILDVKRHPHHRFLDFR
jgi:hypothetical protein